MKFLKQNLFLVCLALGTLAVGGGLIKMYSGYTSEGKALIALRTEASGKLNRLRSSKPLVNPVVLAHAKDRVEKMKEMRQRVAEESLRRNCAGRKVMVFPTPGNAGGPIHAFPINKKDYYDKSLRLKFATVYREQLQEIYKQLKPTRPPTTEEIQAEAAAIAERTAPLPASPITPVRTPQPVAPNPGGVMDPGIYGPVNPGGYGPMPPGGYGPMPPGGRTPRRYPRNTTILGPTYRSTPGSTATTTPAPGAEGPAELTPAEKARRRLVSRQAGAGEVYADPDTSLYVAVSPSPSPINDDTLLWRAQLSLWIQQDIAAAIRRTNEGYRRWHGGKGREKGVPSSAVKRLLSTRVLGYVVNRSGTGADGALVAPGMDMDGGMGIPAGDAGTGVNLSYLGAGSTGGAPGTGGPTVPKLTGRHCNPIYDVVHYEFTAIVAATELVRLEKNLMAQNNHTILRVETTRVGAKADNTGGDRGMVRVGNMGVGGPVVDENLFYYGTDPVVQVRIVGELLMLTDWTRGREKAAIGGSPPGAASGGKIVWDEKYPALMPVDVLQKIRDADGSALRDVDRRRVEAEGRTTPVPAMPMY